MAFLSRDVARLCDLSGLIHDAVEAKIDDQAHVVFAKAAAGPGRRMNVFVGYKSER